MEARKIIQLFLIILVGINLVLGSDTASDEEPKQPTVEERCNLATDCIECTRKHWDCVWCEGNNVCTEGWFFGPKSNKCEGSWGYKQCQLPGLYVLIGAFGFVGLVLIFLLCCCFCCNCCCCCGGKKKGKGGSELTNFHDAMYNDEVESLITPSEKRRSLIYNKYDRKSKRR
eukprot:TRINITY_DN3038_c0_g2_i1.p1 TRINITY_DN3038_c0_g2~~TRINITY_DN3038_c0_g2_i1.p1  ORF type:complete len:172 (-),score=29.32 TRINITY_DN3038_c0_g2_i1:36-551(-)